MNEVALAIRIGREPERERGKLVKDRKQFERGVLVVRTLGCALLGVAAVAEREVWQRRDAHCHRQVGLVGIGKVGAQRDGVALEFHHATSHDQLGTLAGDGTVRRDGEDVIARPERVVAGLQVRPRDRQAVDVFALIVALENRLAIEQDVPRPASVIHANFLHLHAARGGDGIRDGALLLQLVHREIGLVVRDEAKLDGGGGEGKRDDEESENDEWKTLNVQLPTLNVSGALARVIHHSHCVVHHFSACRQTAASWSSIDTSSRAGGCRRRGRCLRRWGSRRSGAS